MVVCALYDGDGVDLHVADMLDRLSCAGQTKAEGRFVQESLSI